MILLTTKGFLTFYVTVILLVSKIDAESRGSKFFRRCFFTPHQCPNKNVTFHLYTREHQNRPTQLEINKPKSILKAKFAKNRPLVVLIHGYTGHKDFAPNKQIRPAYFKRNEFNIISVDYKNLALEPCYPMAVSNLPTVANCTAQLLDFLIDKNIFTIDSIHVIGLCLKKFVDSREISNFNLLGFSLGAQTAGMIANFLKEGRKLKRITGLGEPCLIVDKISLLNFCSF